MVEGLLEGVETKLNVDFFKDRSYWEAIADKIVYTGAIDDYFDYKLGKLEWRTVSFEEELFDIPNYQGNAVMNFTEAEVPYTRIIEHKHFEMFGQEIYDCPLTVISREFSAEYKDGMETYHTVNDDRNNVLAEQYRQLANNEKNVIFGGRLADISTTIWLL